MHCTVPLTPYESLFSQRTTPFRRYTRLYMIVMQRALLALYRTATHKTPALPSTIAASQGTGYRAVQASNPMTTCITRRTLLPRDYLDEAKRFTTLLRSSL